MPGKLTGRERLIEVGRGLEAALSQRRAEADDTGASLILALIFLIVAALTLTALVSFAGTGLLDTAGFTSERGLQYGADGAVEIAIQHVRYQTVAYTTLANCLGSTATTTSSVQLTEFQVTAQYSVYCNGVTYPSVPTFSSTATVTVKGITVTTSRLFTVSHASFVGYGLSVVGTSTVSSVLAETTSAHTVQVTPAVRMGTSSTIELLAPYQRLVTFYACRVATCTVLTTSTVKKMTTTPKKVLVKAVVGFGDLMPTGKDECKAPTTASCGESYVVTQWSVSSANQ